MIKSKKQLSFYIKADRIMNGLPKSRSFREVLGIALTPTQRIAKFMLNMRRLSYYSARKNKSLAEFIGYYISSRQYRKLSLQLGFSIGYDVFGYGLLIPHHGTIVVNGGVRVGNYCVLHTSTCIGGSDKTIGNGLYLSSGSMIMGKLTIGDGVSVAANSLVNKSFGNNVLLTGSPANVKRKDYPMWYVRDGEKYSKRVEAVEKLKIQMYE